jgi:AcrR family transcriptional regulator
MSGTAGTPRAFPGEAPPTTPPLPRGRHGLPHAFIVTNQRRRLQIAIAEACAEKTYPAVRIKDITDGARVSRRTFYDLFSDKEDCFLATYDVCIEAVFISLNRAYAAAGPSWEARVGAALKRLLELCAEEPAFAHLVVVDVHTAGRVALERRDATLRRFAQFLEPGRSGLPPALARYEPLTEAVIGGLCEALYNRIKVGDAEQLPALTQELHYCTLVPFVGHAKALAASHTAAA